MSRRFVITIVVLTTLIIAALLVWLKWPVKYTNPKVSQSVPLETVKKEEPVVSQSEVQAEQKVLIHTLRKALPDGSYEVISTSTDSYFFFDSAAIWNDWLFFTKTVSTTQDNETKFNMQVVAYNFKTSEKKIIFDAKKNGYGLFKSNIQYDEMLFNDIWVLHDNLYIQFGGSDTTHLIWAKLPINGNFRKLISGSGKNIFTINKTYWLQSGFGDACVSNSQLRFFDPIGKTVGPEIAFFDDCGTGKEFISQRGQDLIVQEFHRVSTTDYSEKSIIDKIYLLNFKNLSKRPLLSGTRIPSEADPYGVYYNQPNDSLLFLGKDMYTYNFKTDKLKKIASGLSKYHLSEWTEENKACLSLRTNTADHGEYALLDIVTGEVSFSTEKCYEKGTEFEYHYSGAEYLHPKTLSTIELPVGFEFVTEN